MKIIRYKAKALAFLIALMSSWVLLGCGSDPALDTYKANMDVYFDGVAKLDDAINSIDPLEDLDGERILKNLDQLLNITSQMADLEVPEQFYLAESLADEAYENMSEAVSLYHQIYESDIYNESMVDGAYEYYERANKRIFYIRDILHGEMPAELEITEDE